MAALVAAAAAGWWQAAGWLVGGGGGIDLWLGRESLLFSLVEDFYTRSQCYSRVAAHALGGAFGVSSGLLA